MRKAARKELDFDLDYDDDAPAEPIRKAKRARVSATSVGVFGLGALCLAIVVNAAFLQDQKRNAPLFKITLAEETKPAQPVQQTLPPLPPARVVEAPPQPKPVPPEAPRPTASTGKVDLIAREIGRGDPIAKELARTEAPAPKVEKPVVAQKPVQAEAKVAEKPRAAPVRAEPRRNDAIAGLIDKPAPAQSGQARETASTHSREAPSADVRAAQRDLQRLGFVIAPNGVFDAATRKAIAQFERDSNMPARGELTAAVKRELSRRASGETQ